MSLREEDRQNKNCPSRGLGLAAAAIGVGVGAALYYFFSKRPENPHEEGSTSNWECEQAQTFMTDDYEDSRQMSNDSYTTLSEHSTTDTSIHESTCNCGIDTSLVSDNESLTADTDDDDDDDESDFEQTSEDTFEDSYDGGYLTVPSTSAVTDDSDNDWDVTDSSMDVPEDTRGNRSPLLRLFDSVGAFVSPIRNRRRNRMSEEEQMMRAQAFRERSWSLEECSICFEVILKNQEVMSLPCTHHFHQACILPWLQEQQTCPNCRKAAE
ncbi:uncharacterized protein [Epargyreus clarus]|uniref:uncharacterized protein isoform X2 n=1 Tax=Epargyreus clarus TaxID=520877 RepID=UPI003C2EE81D